MRLWCFILPIPKAYDASADNLQPATISSFLLFILQQIANFAKQFFFVRRLCRCSWFFFLLLWKAVHTLNHCKDTNCDNKEVDDFWGAKSTVAGNEAFQINVILKSTQNLTVWVFKQGDKVYMMSFEGDEDTLYEFIPYIEETWSVSKDGGTSI